MLYEFFKFFLNAEICNAPSLVSVEKKVSAGEIMGLGTGCIMSLYART